MDVPVLQSSGQCRATWAAQMRLHFSPGGMIDSKGNINQEFFKPTQLVLVNEKRWGLEETELLHMGLEKFGVGKWRDISSQLLPAWEDQQIRIRAAKLFGSQSLARYVGWRGSKAAVQAEYAKNKAIGEATACWKHGMLVENDQGSVKLYLDAQAGGPGEADLMELLDGGNGGEEGALTLIDWIASENEASALRETLGLGQLQPTDL